jgi:hypothetical protein
MKRNLIAIAVMVLAIAAPALMAGQPASTQPVASGNPSTTQFTLHFVDAPVEDVLHTICSAGGYALIVYVPIDGRVTFVKDKPISPEKALEIMKLLLKDRGYTAMLEDSVVKIEIRTRLRT